ncbi:c-type cytochrome [Sulfurimonas sp. NW7]
MPQTTTADGAKLFTACSSCHGAHAEKKALGKSQIIKGWDKTKIITALKGYKDGTYGGAMKAVMKGQAAKLSDADIKALAEYISQL